MGGFPSTVEALVALSQLPVSGCHVRGLCFEVACRAEKEAVQEDLLEVRRPQRGYYLRPLA